jgi:hypothetical protein
MTIINYEKRKNAKLFESFLEKMGISDIQNYIPIYSQFFSLTSENYNNINLNHPVFITDIKDKSHELDSSDAESEINENLDINNNDEDYYKNIYNVILSQNGKVFERKCFFKVSPILEPMKFLIGKYKLNDDLYSQLPAIEKQPICEDFYDLNNTCYVDGFFSYLSSKLLEKYDIVNCLDFYGSFLGIKQNFELDIGDEFEYLSDSEFFMKNKGLFKIGENTLVPLNIGDDTCLELDDLEPLDPVVENVSELVDLSEVEFETFEIASRTSNSSCSSRASVTTDENDSEEEEENGIKEGSDKGSDNGSSDEESDEDESKEGSDSDDSSFEELLATFEKFSVQINCLEHCTDTLDNLITNKEFVEDNEWYACFLQIIFTLLCYQKAFDFTHNDLHTNNIMYIPTKLPFLYYKYKNQYYKVPTYGRIFKIIDFGRSIYKFKGKIFCSNSFQPGGDASTQYNTEPYFDEKKARIDPNYSFDICRLACSIWDNLFPSIHQVDKIVHRNPVAKLVNEWCKDNKGTNILYKQNGEERYPNFKLYKMIARLVHNHTPQNQLQREEFSQFLTSKNKIKKYMNIDEIEKFI